jgi:glycosyltransferase involved in cell wall biosynthesis
MNPRQETIYLHVWTGDTAVARALVERQLPQCSVVELSHKQLRGGGWKGQLVGLRALKGRALVVFFKSLNDAPQLQLVLWSGLVHRCRETIVSDESGEFRVYRRSDWVGLFPRMVASLVFDAAVLLSARLLLQLWKTTARPQPFGVHDSPLDVAYVFPYPLVRDTAGGAMSHIRGVLGGIAANQASCEVYSGAPLPVKTFPVHEIPARRRFYFFWESLMLSYGIHFARRVHRQLGKTRPRLVYQRHGRFTVAGAILSKALKAPFVLEYNGSELWMANYWDPTRFRSWMRLCEEVALRCASLVVVVSDPIRDELLERGIPAARVMVNPNAVDPDQFHPGCGGAQLRRELGIGPEEITVGFVGTFGPWHGIQVLEQAIHVLLGTESERKLRFLLVGDGLLRADLRKSLQEFERSGQVVLPGIVPHDQVCSYLDASDILVSPHVPLPDGRPFFGSPTKLFEYMAMGKAIVASRLDQLAQVLSHAENAYLVEPGSVQELVDAIRLLVNDGGLRGRLGAQARETAIARHTWRRNVEHVLARSKGSANPAAAVSPGSKKQLAHSESQ